MTKILFYGCDIRKRVGIGVVEFFFCHSVEVLTKREFNTFSLPTRDNTAEKRVFSILDNTVDADGLFKFGKPIIRSDAVQGFAILFVGGRVSRDIHTFDLRVAIDKSNELVKIVANASGIDVNILVRRNSIDDFSESEDVCHRLTTCDYNLWNVERIIVTKDMLYSIYNIIERRAVFGVFFFAFTERAAVGTVERYHNGNGKIVAT
jgi:hypothetical protein